MSGMSSKPVGVLSLLLAAILSLTICIAGSYGCPSGCICRGRPEMRDTAVCYRPWRASDGRVVFSEPIRALEFRHISFLDMVPYLSAARSATALTIYPLLRTAQENPLPANFFSGMGRLESLTIHPTRDRHIPPGLGRVLAPLTRLRTIDFVGNMMDCDCTLPAYLSSHNVFLIGKDRMPAVRGCLSSEGFRSRLYRVDAFLQECARHGNYRLQLGEAGSAGPTGLGNRQFGNVQDRNSFRTGVTYQRINENQGQPSRAQSAPNSFAGALREGTSGNDQVRGNSLLQGYLPTNGRRPPSVSLSNIFSRAQTASRRRSGRAAARRLMTLDQLDDELSSSLDEEHDVVAGDGDGDGGGERTERTSGVNNDNNNGTEQRLVAEAMPILTAPNGNPGQATGNAIVVPPLETAVNPHVAVPVGPPVQALAGAQANQQRVTSQEAVNRPASQLGLRGAPLRQRSQHRSRPLSKKQLQLALYRLPMNDLTIRLNPFDPFEVDLFFQYVLHEENLPGSSRFPRI